jgi:hypothetical protein
MQARAAESSGYAEESCCFLERRVGNSSFWFIYSKPGSQTDVECPYKSFLARNELVDSPEGRKGTRARPQNRRSDENSPDTVTNHCGGVHLAFRWESGRCTSRRHVILRIIWPNFLRTIWSDRSQGFRMPRRPSDQLFCYLLQPVDLECHFGNYFACFLVR